MGTPESSWASERPPAWVDVVEYVGNVGVTVLHGLRGDLTDRRARLAVALVEVADGVGTAVLRHRYPRPRSADMRLVSAAMTSARDRGELDVAELRRDPAFRAAQDRLNRRTAWLLVYGASALAAQRLLLGELKRRRVRRPHLVAGLALAAAQSAYRVGTLVAERRQRVGGHA